MFNNNPIDLEFDTKPFDVIEVQQNNSCFRISIFKSLDEKYTFMLSLNTKNGRGIFSIGRKKYRTLQKARSAAYNHLNYYVKLYSNYSQYFNNVKWNSFFQTNK